MSHGMNLSVSSVQRIGAQCFVCVVAKRTTASLFSQTGLWVDYLIGWMGGMQLRGIYHVAAHEGMIRSALRCLPRSISFVAHGEPQKATIVSDRL